MEIINTIMCGGGSTKASADIHDVTVGKTFSSKIRPKGATGSMTIGRGYSVDLPKGPAAPMKRSLQNLNVNCGVFVRPLGYVLLFTSSNTAYTYRPNSKTDSVGRSHNTPSGNWIKAIDADGAIILLGGPEGTNRYAYSSSTNRHSSWTTAQLPNSNNWIDIAYNSINHKYCMISTDGSANNIANSDDGRTWRISNFPTEISGYSLKAISSGVHKFVAVGTKSTSGVVISSKDGVNWSVESTPAGAWTNIAYGNGKFIAVNNTNEILVGTETISENNSTLQWTTAKVPRVGRWTNIFYAGGIFILVDNNPESKNKWHVSVDGFRWESIDTDGLHEWTDFVYTGDRIIGLCKSGSGARMHIVRHEIQQLKPVNKITPTGHFENTQLTTTRIGGSGVNEILDVVAADTSYGRTVVALTSSKIYIKRGGAKNWEVRDTPPQPANNERWQFCAIYRDQIYVVSMNHHKMCDLDDGYSWKTGSMHFPMPGSPMETINIPYLDAVGTVGTGAIEYITQNSDGEMRWAFGFYAACGGFTTCYFPKNRNTAMVFRYGAAAPVTKTFSPSETYEVSAAEYGEGIFAAISKDGTRFSYSKDDGETWTTRVIAHPSFYQINDLVYGDGMFVAFGKNLSGSGTRPFIFTRDLDKFEKWAHHYEPSGTTGQTFKKGVYGHDSFYVMVEETASNSVYLMQIHPKTLEVKAL